MHDVSLAQLAGLDGAAPLRLPLLERELQRITIARQPRAGSPS
ncbi:MAG: hypothetical protein R3E65_05430 [Steroidobacteraceae bacterium]